jgi:hypothetical protein
MKATSMLWSPLQRAYGLVRQAAQILANDQQHTGAQVRERYLAFVRQMQEQKAGSVVSLILKDLSVKFLHPITCNKPWMPSFYPKPHAVSSYQVKLIL